MATSPADTIAAENRAAAGAFEGVGRYTTRPGDPPPVAWYRRLPVSAAFIGAGVLIVAACVLGPARAENARLDRDLATLRGELDLVRRQIDVNGEFLRRAQDDPELAERLALRQTRRVAPGKKVLEFERPPVGPFDASPFAITRLPPGEVPAAPIPASRATAAVEAVVTDVRSRIVLLGGALFVIGAGVVLGFASSRR